MTGDSPTPAYLEAISILAAALRDIRDAYPPGHFGHDTAHAALDKADRIQPAQPEPELRFALVEQMGHRSTIATVQEVTFCGKPMLELTNLKTSAVHLVAPDSLYEVTWLTEADARARATPWTAVALPAGQDDDDDDDEDLDYDDGRDDGMSDAEKDAYDRESEAILDALDEAAGLEREAQADA